MLRQRGTLRHCWWIVYPVLRHRCLCVWSAGLRYLDGTCGRDVHATALPYTYIPTQACPAAHCCAVLAFRDTVLAAETCEELFTPQAPHIDLALAGGQLFA